MRTARRLDLNSGHVDSVEARAYKIGQEIKPSSPSVYFSPEYGSPLTFVIGKNLSTHFRRASGDGLTHPLRLKRQTNEKTSFAEGHKTLLMLGGHKGGDNVFSYRERALNFGKGALFGTGNWPLDRWIAANKGDFTGVAVNDTCDAVRKIRELHSNFKGTDKRLSQYCFAYFGGAVLPYDKFYYSWDLGNKDKLAAQQGKLTRLVDLFDNDQYGLQVHNKEPNRKKDFNRIVAMPVLMCVSATKSTIIEKGANGLRCNSYQDSPESHMVVGITAASSAVEETSAYQAFRKGMVAGKKYYVLAAPVVSTDPEKNVQLEKPEGKHEWHNVRFVLNDASRQVCEVGMFGP